MPDELKQAEPLDISLFRTFSRFEYALKKSGYLKCPEDGKKAKPDWGMFADSVADHLTAPPSGPLQAAIDYLQSSPPKVQYIKDGMPEFEDAHPSGETGARLVLSRVCQVRNNLFHGAKGFQPEWSDGNPLRDQELMLCCVTILESCLDANDKIKQAYRG